MFRPLPSILPSPPPPLHPHPSTLTPPPSPSPSLHHPQVDGGEESVAEVVIPLVGPRWNTIRKVSLTPDPLTSLTPPTPPSPPLLHTHHSHFSTSTHTTQWPSFIHGFLPIRLKLWVKGIGTSLWRSPTECKSENALPLHHPAPHWSSDVCTTIHNHVHIFFCQLNLTDCTSSGACPVPVSSL